jgi:hypothetical protein
MPRGGKRPGSGAPKGNLNRLKHGKHSKQLSGVISSMNPQQKTKFIQTLKEQGATISAEANKASSIKDLPPGDERCSVLRSVER